MPRPARRETPAPTPSAPPSAPTPAPKLIPLTAWPDHHPWPSHAGLRWLVFNAETNGFERAFVRVGRRVLVNEAEFFAAVARNNAARNRPAAAPRRGVPKSVPVLDREDAA